MPTATSPQSQQSTPHGSVSLWEPGWSRARTLWVAVVGGAILTICCFAPRFWLWPATGLPLSEFIALQPEFHRAYHALHQLQDPWQRIDDPVNRVIEWRLFWPLLGHYLGFSRGLYLALPHLGALLALGAVAELIWRTTRATMPTLTATIIAATSSWFFVSTGWLAYFDAWLTLALLLAAFGHSRWLLFGTAILAPWIDERFILALPLCLAVRAMGVDRNAPRERRELLRDAGALLGGILPYVAVRIGAEIVGSRATSGAYWSDRSFLPAPPHAMLWGAWNGLRLGWVAVGIALAAAIRTRSHLAWWLVALLTLALNLCVADDVSRSASVALPLVLAAALFVWRDNPIRAQRLVLCLAAGNLLLPAQHVIGAAATRERFHCLPILSLPAEYARAKQPPEFADASAYVRRSIDHLQNRALERSLVAAEIALHFAPDSPKAIANHAVLLYVTGKSAEGLAQLDRALTQAPELYEARMQRAAFRQQAGDLRGALDDVREALRVMPVDWPRRQDAEGFERSLAAQVAGR